jgi:hypothetical protein
VRTISASVRLKTVSCARFSIRATKIRPVRAFCRFVRAVFESVRAKTHPCAHFSICAAKTRVFEGIYRLQVFKKRQLKPILTPP